MVLDDRFDGEWVRSSDGGRAAFIASADDHDGADGSSTPTASRVSAAGVTYAIRAPALAATSTDAVPSRFMTTKDHCPSSTGQRKTLSSRSRAGRDPEGLLPRRCSDSSAGYGLGDHGVVLDVGDLIEGDPAR